ncbi:hypothetical protein FA95DRAFT_1575542 [Auriscalpium vulgare]|uniref:Uncharacterized protein n=1 Tax=Auriscalpium vulgare TaxID=40419 RepID=A0ACB8RFR6_9AGAM|nr:hypothetical protein FA95DRAFT_1575542 [Auriscalpium vulgare]
MAGPREESEDSDSDSDSSVALAQNNHTHPIVRHHRSGGAPAGTVKFSAGSYAKAARMDIAPTSSRAVYNGGFARATEIFRRIANGGGACQYNEAAEQQLNIPGAGAAVRKKYGFRCAYKTFFLTMVEPDAPTPQNRSLGEVRHIIAPDVSALLVNATPAITEYLSPDPPAGSYAHCYLSAFAEATGLGALLAHGSCGCTSNPSSSSSGSSRTPSPSSSGSSSSQPNSANARLSSGIKELAIVLIAVSMYRRNKV